jgi:flagellar biosynthetic protein FliR
MMPLDHILTLSVPTFLLLLARCAGVVAFGPVFGSQNLPPMLRAGLAGALALLLTPLLVARNLALPESVIGLAGSLLGEVAIGAVLGLAVRFLFAGIGMAGELAAVQMGVGLPAALDPQILSQVTSVNLLLDQIAILTFLVVGGHHAVLAALAQSVSLAPPLSVAFHGGSLQFLLGLFGAALTLAIRLAAPVGAAMLATMVTLGLLNRIAPQVNVFMVSFALTLGVGLLVLLAALPVLGTVMAGSFRQLPETLGALLLRLRHGI